MPFLIILILILGICLSALALAAYNRPHLAREIFPQESAVSDKNGGEMSELLTALQSGLLLLHALLWLGLGAVGYSIFIARAGDFPALQPFWLYLLGIGVIFLDGLFFALGLARSESLARSLAPLARFVLFFSRLPHKAMLWIVSRFVVEETPTAQDVEEEIIELLDSGQEEGSLESEKSRLIHSVFDFSDTYARAIMVPRVDIVALEMNMNLQEAVEILVRSGHSRLPLYRDTIDQIIGLIYAKDILRVWSKNQRDIALASLARPVYFIPETKRINTLLNEMRQQRIHMAIVVDEYGGVAGLVTLEDIIEELLGEIQDEFDQGEELPFQSIDANQAVFLGKIDLNDFNDIMGTDFPKEEADTLGGYIYTLLGRTPTTGEQVTVGNILLTIEQVSGQRIRKVRAQRIEMGDNTDEQSNNR